MLGSNWMKFLVLVGCVVWWQACPLSPGEESVVEHSGDGGVAEILPEPPGAPTWFEHVLPLFERHCVGCHRVGGAAPFALKELSQVKEKEAAVKWAVESGRMPPWMPDEDCQKMRDSRKLLPYEKETILRWFAQGMVVGSERVVGPFERPSLKWVDRELKNEVGYRFPKEPRGDDYRCFVYDPKLEKDEELIGYEIVPGAKKRVHHVLLFQMELAGSKAKEQEPGQGWACYGSPGGQGSLIGTWLPGAGAIRYPEGTGIQLKKGMGIVVQIHYDLSQKSDETDQSLLRLQLARSPVERRAILWSVADLKFEIPPKSQSFRSVYETLSPAGGKIWGVMPHMHSLGKRIHLEIKKAGGNSVCLVDIPRWDFDWQQTYFYRAKEGLKLEKGDRLVLSCTWDNPTDQKITWGDSAKDEMCVGFLYITR